MSSYHNCGIHKICSWKTAGAYYQHGVFTHWQKQENACFPKNYHCLEHLSGTKNENENTAVRCCVHCEPKLSRPSKHCWDASIGATNALHNFIQLKFISWLRWLTYWHRILHMFQYINRNVPFADTDTRKLCSGTVFAVMWTILRRKQILVILSFLETLHAHSWQR